jgi:ribosomal protein S18 acetylase RimI-like enzyme
MTAEPVAPSDRSQLLAIAVATGLFTADEADGLLGGVLDQLANNSLPAGHSALLCRTSPGSAAVGWTYFAPDPHADGVWNVWWLGVEPGAHGTGAGALLLRQAEAQAAAGGGRLVIVETSAKDAQARARRFYAKEGYAECGRVPDFYGDGDDKVIFARRPRSG